MTEKRFVGLFQGNMLVSVKDTKTNNRVNIVQMIEIGNKLNYENEHFKQTNKKVIDKILDGIVEMHDGKRDYAKKLFNEAIELIK